MSSASSRVLMAGNEAAGEGAIRAGCRHYYGYPITPQNELTAYMARRMHEVGGTFIQAESEISAINMVYGTAAAGARAMTSSSSPGISLKQEGISYLAGSELPAVIINVQRGGPGLGDISPSQSDYFQATKGGGHGDYKIIVLAPYSVQEFYDLVYEAFDLADLYRIPVMVLADGQLGQMMEPVELRDRPRRKLPRKDWALTGASNRPRNIVKSFYPVKGELEEFNKRLQKKYRLIERREVRFERYGKREADVTLVAYGTVARICREVLRSAPSEFNLQLIRPITLYPFPKRAIANAAKRTAAFLTVEMSAGQMVEDVRLAVEGVRPVYFYGRMGGAVPTASEVLREVRRIIRRMKRRRG